MAEFKNLSGEMRRPVVEQAGMKQHFSIPDMRPQAAAQRKLLGQMAAGSVLQRATISEALARERILERAPGFVGSEITGLWDPDTMAGSNCHGYTLNGVPGHEMDWRPFFEDIKESQTPMAVYVQDGSITHSGLLVGGNLEHLLIGIGILRTAFDAANPRGYERVYVLPGNLEGLRGYIMRELMSDEFTTVIVGIPNDDEFWDLREVFYDARDAVEGGDALPGTFAAAKASYQALMAARGIPVVFRYI